MAFQGLVVKATGLGLMTMLVLLATVPSDVRQADD